VLSKSAPFEQSVRDDARWRSRADEYLIALVFMGDEHFGRGDHRQGRHCRGDILDGNGAIRVRVMDLILS